MWGKGWRFMDCRVWFAIKQQGWIYNSSSSRSPKCLNLIRKSGDFIATVNFQEIPGWLWWCFQLILSNQFMFPFISPVSCWTNPYYLVLVCTGNQVGNPAAILPWPSRVYGFVRWRCCWWCCRPWFLSRIPWPLSNVSGGRGSLQMPRWRTASPPPVKMVLMFSNALPQNYSKLLGSETDLI